VVTVASFTHQAVNILQIGSQLLLISNAIYFDTDLPLAEQERKLQELLQNDR